MKKTIVATVLVSLSVLTSCSDDALVNAGKGTLTLQTSTEPYTNVQSRTQVGGMNADGSLGMYWTPDDKISVYGGSQNNVVFTNVNTEAGVNATFSGTFNGTPEYAFYPYSEKATTLSAIPVEIPTEQTYTDESSIANYDIKGGSISKTDNGAYTINFSQLASLVRFEIDLSGVEGLELVEGETLESVQLHAQESKTLTGDFTVDVTNKGLTAGTTATSSLTITFAETPALTSTSETIVAYAVVAPGTHMNEEWECDITTSHHWIQFYTTVKADLEQGKFSILPLNATVLKASHHYDNNGEKVSGPYIDTLGEEEENPDTPTVETPEPANCYMVSAAGTYVFDATVIGNGEDGIIADAGFHTTTATIVPKSVELLWQDTQNFITAVSLDESTGIVSYTTGGNVGNAQIAVKDEKETILWSWHIWGTGDIAVSDDEYTNQAGATFTVMDRNLGQLKMVRSTDLHTEGEAMYVKEDGVLYSEKADAIETICCTLYQWGRKDPVPSAGTRYNINNEATDISTSYPVLNYNNFSSADEATIEYSIQNPAYLIDTYKYTSNQIWEKDGNPYLWGGGASTTYVSDMTSETAGAGWENSKTIYDPCPAGYRVANPYTWTGFIGSTSSRTAQTNQQRAATYVDYNNDGIYSDDEKITNLDPDNDNVPIVDGKERLLQDLKVIASYYEENSGYTKWVIKDGDYLLNSTEETEGAVECNYVTRYYAPVYCQGLFFKGNETDNIGAFYPMISYRNGSNGAFNTAGLGYYWSSGQGSSTPSAYYLQLKPFSHNSNGNISITIDVFDTRSGKRDALPVRCVREN